MGAENADPGDPAARQCAARDRHFIGEDARGGDHLGAIEKRQGTVELGDLAGNRELLVGGERRPKGTPHERRVRTLLVQPDRPEFEAGRRAYR